MILSVICIFMKLYLLNLNFMNFTFLSIKTFIKHYALWNNLLWNDAAPFVQYLLGLMKKLHKKKTNSKY